MQNTFAMWSIGIYSGSSPFDLCAHPGATNPVITSQSVTDVPATLVADPFMIRVSERWYMFFEVMNRLTNKGEIGLATSANGLEWTYQQIVLAEPFHLSYPHVFEWEGSYYLIPEALKSEAVCLYRADDFPTRWSLTHRLFSGSAADPSIFHFEDKWWMFVCSTPYQHDTLRLYYSADLEDGWREHPASPIVERDQRKARPGGKVLVLSDRIVRFAQDCFPTYGSQLRAFSISELTTTSYTEQEHQESPVLTAGGQGWNGLGMHHLDAHALAEGQWLACVDGFGPEA